MPPVLTLTIGDVDLDPVPPRDAVRVEGGGRPPSERTALDGTILVSRPARPLSRRLTITAPERFVLRTEQTNALAALAASGERFSVTLQGYELAGTFGGCMFTEPPRFPPTAHPEWRGYVLTIYLPQ